MRIQPFWVTKISLFFIIILCLLYLTGCGGGGGVLGPGPSTETFALGGYVYRPVGQSKQATSTGLMITNNQLNDGNYTPVVNATVKKESNLSDSTQTDSRGRFSFSGMTVGEYNIIIDPSTSSNASTYANETESFGVYNPNTSSSVSSLKVVPVNTTVPLGKKREFRVIMKDGDGNVIFPLEVTWSVESGIGTITSAGIFTATTAGTGRVIATYGSLSAYSVVRVIDESGGGGEVETGTLVGIVTQGSNFVKDIVIRVTGISTAAITNINGYYSIPGIPAGSYPVSASQNGEIVTTQQVTITAGATTQCNFTIPSPPRSWKSLGTVSFGQGTWISLYVYNGIPYVACIDQGNANRATVRRYNGTSWENVGTGGRASAGEVQFTYLYIYNGTPYVIYQDFTTTGGKATVRLFNGTTWENVGNVGFSEGRVGYTSIYVYNGTPYVAYTDGANDFKATVMKYNGTTWENVGNVGFSTGVAVFPFVTVCDGTPYVAYTDNGDSVVMVKRYNGTSWENVGSFSTYANTRSGLFNYNETLYMAYNDRRYGGLITVVKYNGTTWETIGDPGFATGGSALSLYVYDGRPYVTYHDNSNYSWITMMSYNGTSWEYNGVCWADYANESSLFVYNGTAYVAFGGGQARVMKYD